MDVCALQILSIITLDFVQILMLTSQVNSYCEVAVDEPWLRPYIFAPENSTVLINCTTTSDSHLWSIDLASDRSNSQLQFSSRAKRLNDHGVYELPTINKTGMPPTLRLLINDTSRNNGTEIYCDDDNVSFETILYVYEPTQINCTVTEMGRQFINISWSIQETTQHVQSMLMINTSSSKRRLSINSTFYQFTAPEDAPPCEVYNFSVTATYVGATYTGAGCSVPCKMINIMLPSLPDIDNLEHTVQFTLTKPFDELILNISFQPASSCEQYPIVNYTLEVKGPLPEETLQYTSGLPQSLIFGSNNLSENVVYSFRVLVANTVGVTSTNNTTFYTTDVQTVTATIKERHRATIECSFLMGSNANGCMVVLITMLGKESLVKMKRNETTNSAISTITLNYSQSCYQVVQAFDVESDGTVGALAVPGMILRAISMSEECINPTDSFSPPKIIIIISIVVIVVVITIVTIIIVILVFKIFYHRRSSKHSHNEAHNSEPHLVHYEEITDFPTSHAEISSYTNQDQYHLYEQPNNPKGNRKVDPQLAIERVPESGYSRTAHGIRNQNETTDMTHEKTYSKLNKKVDSKAEDPETSYSRTAHGIKNRNVTTTDMKEDKTYSKLNKEEHFYHTLESSRKPCGIEVTIPEALEPSDDQLQPDHDLSSNPSHLNSNTAGDSHKSMKLNDKDTNSL